MFDLELLVSHNASCAYLVLPSSCLMQKLQCLAHLLGVVRYVSVHQVWHVMQQFNGDAVQNNSDVALPHVNHTIKPCKQKGR